jgi:thiamine pyrophosphate-dependent acetolactate synthase large subunit-like protein
VTGKLATFAPHARVIHIEIDPANIGKNVAPDLTLVTAFYSSHHLNRRRRPAGGVVADRRVV